MVERRLVFDFSAVHIFSDAVLLLWPFGGRWSLRSLRGWAAWAWTCSAEPSTILRQITTNHVQWQMEMVLHPLGISRTGCDDDIMWYPAPSSTTDFHSLYIPLFWVGSQWTCSILFIARIDHCLSSIRDRVFITTVVPLSFFIILLFFTNPCWIVSE